jgi:toxin ParE1/3/4
MNTFKVLLSDDARNDLRMVYDYICNTLLEPSIAAKKKNRIIDGIRKLDFMPERHPVYDVEPWKSMGLRKMPVENYLVFYIPFIDKCEVLVVRILYARRDIDSALGDSIERATEGCTRVEDECEPSPE